MEDITIDIMDDILDGTARAVVVTEPGSVW